TYIAYFVDGSVKDTSGTGTADASASPSPSPSPATDAEKAAAMDAAKEIADSIAADGKTEEQFIQAVLAKTQAQASNETTQGSSLNDKYAEWMKDSSRKLGDTTVVEADSGYYAVFYISRDSANYKEVNVRHILIKAVASEDGTYSDEAKATAKQKAEDLLAQWKAGAATEDSFAELAKANSEDTGSSSNGGLYENVARDQMVATFNDWIYAADRKEGDVGIVYGERTASSTDANDGYSGYHVIYFVGTGKTYSDSLSEDAMRTRDYTAWKDPQKL
ncbi:MAG: peptidylprolyl isomerase, partial [Oscillospiraceae bacterium]